MPGVLRRLLTLVALPVLGCARVAETPADRWDPDSVPEAYAHSVAALMWPGATRAFLVSSNGELLNGAWALELVPSADGIEAGPARTVAYERRWRPVARWSRTAGPVRWDFEAVAVPAPAPGLFSPQGPFARLAASSFQAADRQAVRAAFARYPAQRIDTLLMRVRRPLERDPADRANLLVSLEVTATNSDRRAHAARLRFTFQPPPEPRRFFVPDSLVRIPWETCWRARAQRDSVLGWGEGEVRGTTLEQTAEIPAGGNHVFRLVLTGYPARERELRSWARAPHAQRVREARSYWDREVERGARFDMPDDEIQDAIRAARVTLLSLRERRDSDWVPIGGPFHYRDVWLRDGARAIQALAISGYSAEANQLASALLRFQWPHGPFLSQTGQLDGIGQALWAFEQASLRPRPSRATGRFARSALLAWRYVERQRTRPDHRHADSFADMLPFTDPHDDELVYAQLVGNDAWAIAGYRATVRLLRAAHLHREADSVAASLERYARAFGAALERTRRSDIPPSWQGGGIDWGNLAVGYPCAALAPSDPHLEALARRYWADGGGAGLGYYGAPDLRHGYVAADLGTWALLAGHRSVADSVLDAALEWRSASGGAAETFIGSTRDFGSNFPPHPTAAAALLALTRNMLVFDDTDTLQLTLGARAAWWSGTTVERAPTRWGALDLAFHRVGSLAHWKWTPVPVWTALTLPPGTTVAGELPPGFRRAPSPSVVLAPPGTSLARIAVSSAKRPDSRSRPVLAASRRFGSAGR